MYVCVRGWGSGGSGLTSAHNNKYNSQWSVIVNHGGVHGARLCNPRPMKIDRTIKSIGPSGRLFSIGSMIYFFCSLKSEKVQGLSIGLSILTMGRYFQYAAAVAP